MKRKQSEPHGLRFTVEYQIWCAIVQRCCNPNNANFHRYGGRGITICREWRESFATFLKDVGRRPSPELQIDRIDNNVGYFPGNVWWTTRKANSRNIERIRLFDYRGRKLCAGELAEISGLSFDTIRARIRYGWPIEQVVNRPAGKSNRHQKKHAIV